MQDSHGILPAGGGVQATRPAAEPRAERATGAPLMTGSYAVSEEPPVPSPLDSAVAAVDSDLAALVTRLGASHDVADQEMSQFIARIIGNATARGSGGTMNIMVRLPLLVHGAEGGDPAGGASAALIHLLWWTAARYLDDLADGGPTAPEDPAEANRGILAALAAGSHLPVRLVNEAGVPDATKSGVIDELARGWLHGISGQLLDYAARPTEVTLDAVLDSYLGKTGAPYAMASAMAARLAGADPGRVDRWRGVGARFGLLRQLVNDQRDLVSGRDEDLANGTATYLVVHFLQSLPASRRATMVALHADAATSPAAREEFKQHLLSPEVVQGYTDRVGAIVTEVHTTLDELGGAQPYAAHLHDIVDEAMRAFPLPAGTAPGAIR
jgi:heptaprenyl diphosphate synthase